MCVCMCVRVRVCFCVCVCVEVERLEVWRCRRCFFLSDFISLEQMFENPQMSYLARHHDLIPVVIEDPLERAVPQLPGLHLTEDSESGHRRMSYWSKENVNKYQREIERRKESLTSMFYSMNLDSLWIDAGDENFVDRLLEHFLRRRRLS